LTPWLFGRLGVAWEWRAITRQRAALRGNENLAQCGIDENYCED
jgi:hypothetical protein